MSVSEPTKAHNIKLYNREKCLVTGVKEIKNSDDEYIEFYTYFDKVVIKGHRLKIVSLDIEQGKLEFSGEVVNISYQKPKCLPIRFGLNKH